MGVGRANLHKLNIYQEIGGQGLHMVSLKNGPGMVSVHSKIGFSLPPHILQ